MIIKFAPAPCYWSVLQCGVITSYFTLDSGLRQRGKSKFLFSRQFCHAVGWVVCLTAPILSPLPPPPPPPRVTASHHRKHSAVMKTLQQLIRNSQYFLLCLSEEVIKFPWCRVPRVCRSRRIFIIVPSQRQRADTYIIRKMYFCTPILLKPPMPATYGGIVVSTVASHHRDTGFSSRVGEGLSVSFLWAFRFSLISSQFLWPNALMKIWFRLQTPFQKSRFPCASCICDQYESILRKCFS